MSEITQQPNLFQQPFPILKSIFERVQANIKDDESWDHFISGTTATLAIIQNNTLICANIGDSKLIVVNTDGSWNQITMYL